MLLKNDEFPFRQLIADFAVSFSCSCKEATKNSPNVVRIHNERRDWRPHIRMMTMMAIVMMMRNDTDKNQEEQHKYLEFVATE